MLLADESNSKLENSSNRISFIKSPEIVFNMSEVPDSTNCDLNEFIVDIEKTNGMLNVDDTNLTKNIENKNSIGLIEDNLFNCNDNTEEKLACNDIVNGIESDNNDKNNVDSNIEEQIDEMLNTLTKSVDTTSDCIRDGDKTLHDNGEETTSLNIEPKKENVETCIEGETGDTFKTSKTSNDHLEDILDDNNLNLGDVNQIAPDTKGLVNFLPIPFEENSKDIKTELPDFSNIESVSIEDLIILKSDVETNSLSSTLPSSPKDIDKIDIVETNLKSEILDNIKKENSVESTSDSMNDTEGGSSVLKDMIEKMDLDLNTQIDSCLSNISPEIKTEIDQPPILDTNDMVYIASPEVYLTNDKSLSENAASDDQIKNAPEAMECDDLRMEVDNIEISKHNNTADSSIQIKDMNIDSTKSSSIIDTLDLRLSDDEMSSSKASQPAKSDSIKETNAKNQAAVSLDDEEEDGDIFTFNSKLDKTKTATSNVDAENEKVGEPVIENDKSQIILDDDDDVLISNPIVKENSKIDNQMKDFEKSLLPDILKESECNNSDLNGDKGDKSPCSAKDTKATSETDENVKSDNIIEKEVITEPIIPLNFMKAFKSSLGRMTRDDLEEYCLVKIVEAIVKRSNVSEAEAKLKTQMNNIDALRKKLAHVTKQNRDLEIVMKNLCSEHKRRKEELIEPVKISRSVGFQVGPSSVKSKSTPKPTSLPPQLSSHVKSNKMMRTRPAKPNSPVTPSNTANTTNFQRKIPISNTPNTIEEDKPKSAKKDSILKSALSINNQNLSNGIQKQLAEKRISDSSIDLTDDEPPAKQMTLNNRTKATNHTNNKPPSAGTSNTGNGTKLFMMNPHIQSIVNNQKPIMYRPRNAISNQAIPLQNLRAIAMVQSPPRLGIPIKTVGPSSTMPQHRMSQPSFVPSIYHKHPAPLPISRHTLSNQSKFLPPKPDLKISKVPNGIVISWVMEHLNDYRYDDIASYQIYAYQETTAPPHTDLWKKIGDVKALPLPMACTLTQFMAGYKYFFAVRAVDVKSRVGPFSSPGFILLNNEK